MKYYSCQLMLPKLLLLKLGFSVSFRPTPFLLLHGSIIEIININNNNNNRRQTPILFQSRMSSATTTRKRTRDANNDLSNDDKVTTTTSSSQGIVMILSPAKTFDLSSSNIPNFITEDMITKPNCCRTKTNAIATFMKRQSQAELTKLLSLSKSLATTTHEYWQNFNIDDNGNTKNPTNAKPCIYMYSGAAYQGLAIQECNIEAVLYMQQNLRILDAVYGVLRPLDRIQPYRLEMATKNVDVSDDNDQKKSSKKGTASTKLHDYWSEAVTSSLSEDLRLKTSTDISSTILLNLASEEYNVAVNESHLPETCRYIKCVFLDDNRVVSVHAKRARGLMVRYIAENNITSFEGIQQFDSEGYTFVPDRSDDTTLIFNRSKKPTATTSSSKVSKTKTTTTTTTTQATGTKKSTGNTTTNSTGRNTRRKAT